MRLSSECGGKDRRRGNNFADALRKYEVSILPAYMTIPMQTRGRLAAVPFGGPEDTIEIIAAWRPDADNPSLEKILPFLETTQNVQGETSEEL